MKAPTFLAVLAALLTLGSLGIAAPAGATIILSLDLDGLLERSDHVILARVESMSSRWDEQRRIATDVSLRTEQSMKGGLATGETVTLRCLGGAIGEIGMRIAGEPSFQVGDRAIFFLRETSGLLRPVGMSQGVLAVQDRGGNQMVLPGGGDMSLVQPRGNGHLERSPGALLHPRPLAEVLGDIRARLERAHPSIESGPTPRVLE